MSTYSSALALTLAIEVPVFAWLLGPGARWLGATPSTIAAAALTGVLVNLASHPVAFLLVEPLLDRPLGSTAALAVVEVLVLVTEAGVVLMRHRDPVLAATSAGVANLASLSIGLALV